MTETNPQRQAINKSEPAERSDPLREVEGIVGDIQMGPLLTYAIDTDLYSTDS